jgi:hypothetical protein
LNQELAAFIQLNTASQYFPAWVVVNTRRISAFYGMPEKSVRRELTKLAELKMIRLAGWDGRELRPFTAWRNADEFIESSSDDGHVHVGLWDSE